MIKSALVTLVMCLLISCEISENAQNGDLLMQDSMALHNALMQTNDTQSITNNENITETIKAALRLVSYETNIVTESKILGIYKPFYPKANKWVRYTFHNGNIRTTIFTYMNTTEIRSISISEYANQTELANIKINTNNLNIVYSNYQAMRSENNPEFYDADFTYRFKNHKDIFIDFSAINLKQEEIDNYNKLGSIPKNIKTVRVYSKQKEVY